MQHQKIVHHRARDPRARDLERASGWCIVRTNSRRTLRLAQSLSDAGVEAWTPRAVQKKRISKVHMGFRDVEEPIMPGFVFVRARYLPDLFDALTLPVSPHPAFSIFQHAGRVPVIGDRDIINLRDAEEKNKRARRKQLRHTVAVGTAVRPSSGICAGLDGIVEEVKGKSAFVNFGGNHRFQIATWLLIDEESEAA